MTAKHYTAVMEASGWPSAAAFAVLAKCAFHADRKGVIRITQGDLAADVALSRRVVVKWFRDFEECAIIEKVRQGRYRFLDEALDELDERLSWLNKEPSSSAPGADAELSRLQGIRGQNQGIAYRETDDGLWPVLVDVGAWRKNMDHAD